LLDSSPTQKAGRSSNKQQDDNLILSAISLEASREDVFLLGALADRNVVRETEGTVAFTA